MSPYIILDLCLINIIKKLILLKKKIFLYISYKTDNLYIQGVSLIFLKILMNYNIKIYFLNIGFFHRKIYIFDDLYILFGSNNFDIRSIYINQECLIFLSDKIFKKLFFKKLKNNLLNFLYYKKKFFYIKFFYIVSFLNYYFQ
ncbi:phospholipase D-like domain-containing protein [Candidatus Carsonella ruddii]|uniref:phospholipase D-like domain-containing protein n=1 Tax=Carsonella ruddii TaxID=114186 RepID=UPI003D9A50CC